MCEHFLARGCCTLFATHFKRLEELASLYPNCKLWHMQVGWGWRALTEWLCLP